MQEFHVRELIYKVLSYLRGMWRHRGIMVALSWFVCTAGWVTVYLMEDQYVSNASVEIVNPEGEITPFLKDMVMNYDVTTEARSLLGKLLTQENLMEVVRESDLALRVNSQEELQELLYELRLQVNVSSSAGKGSIYYISHRHHEAKITYQVVQALMTILRREAAGGLGNPKIQRTAQQFLDEQIREYQAQLAEAELALQDFKRRNVTLLPNGGSGGYHANLKELMDTLGKEKLHLLELEKKREELLRKINGVTGTGISPTAALEQKITTLTHRLEELQNKFYIKNSQRIPLYDTSHPDVISLKQNIALLQQRREEVAKGVNESSSANPELDYDPVYQQFKMSLAEVDVDLASVRPRVQEYENKLAEFSKLGDTLPALEAELLRFELNHNNIKNKLLSLLSQQGNAKFSGDVAEGLTRHVQIRVISDPVLPRQPAGPNRPLFLTVVLMAGLVAGLSMTLIVTLMRPVFDSPAALKKELGLPVLGTVSMRREPRGNTWLRSDSAFFFAMIGLFVAYFGVMVPLYL